MRIRSRDGCQLEQAVGGYPDKGLTIEAVNWIQVVQQPVTDPALRLVSRKALRLRVDVTAPEPGQALPPTAVLRLALNSGGCRDYPLTTEATEAPTVIDRGSLRASYVAVIPAAEVNGDLRSVQVAIDAERASTPDATDRLYAEFPVSIQPELAEEVLIMPIAFDGKTGHFAPETQMADLVQRLSPLQNITFTLRPSITTVALTRENATRVQNGIYYFNYDRMMDVLTEVDDRCIDLNRGARHPAEARKCAAAFPENVRFSNESIGSGGAVTGLAYVGGLSLLSMSFDAVDLPGVTGPYASMWLQANALVFIHELSHVQTLDHANCGSPGSVDSSLYADGTLGEGGGYDVGRDFYFAGSEGGFYDLMSYCGTKLWLSDKGFQKIVNYKTAAMPGPGTEASAGRATAADQAPAARPTGLRLTRRNGVWTARRTWIPETVVDSVHATDGGYVHAALKGLPVKALSSDLGQSPNGPLYIQAPEQLLKGLPILFR